jgi:hypothetical protein
MKVNCLATKRPQCLYVRFYRVLPTVTMTIRFSIAPFDNISSKTTRIAFFIVKISSVFEIFIYIHHNLEVSHLLLLQ